MSDETTTIVDPQSNPSESDSDNLTGHAYDGIEEYDNPLPGWWTTLFWISILFSPVYYLYAHAGPESRTIHGEFEKHKSEIMQVRFKDIGELNADRETLLKYMKEKEWLSVGRSVYQANCVSCHGSKGEGLVGPNLTDNRWKSVSHIEDIAKVISDGAANGAMPAWKKRLSHPNLIVLTAAYVASLSESPVPGRAPEGDRVIESWE